jgi:hypothetical protein
MFKECDVMPVAHLLPQPYTAHGNTSILPHALSNALLLR